MRDRGVNDAGENTVWAVHARKLDRQAGVFPGPPEVRVQQADSPFGRLPVFAVPIGDRGTQASHDHLQSGDGGTRQQAVHADDSPRFRRISRFSHHDHRTLTPVQ